MKKKILNNLGLKLLSVVIAIVLWFVVVMTNNPKDTKRLYNIPVTLTNVELLEEQGKVYSVIDNTDMVSVAVEMPRDKMGELSASDIVAEADVSKLTEINTVPINCYVINESLNVSEISWSRDAVRLNVEDKIDKWVNVSSEVTGEVAEGYIVDNVAANVTRINISGPRSVIEQVASAKLEVDVTNAFSDVSVNVEPSFYNAENELLDLSDITKSQDTVHVDVRILAVKTVPVEINYTGTPEDGYLFTGEVNYEPSEVTISGLVNTLAGVNKITVPAEEVDVTGAEGTYTVTVNIRKYLPAGVTLVDTGSGGRVTVSVGIEAKTVRTLTISEENIRILSLPEGFRAVLDEDEEAVPYLLIVSGLSELVSSIDQNTLTGTIDIADWMEEQSTERLTEGVYEIPVSFELPGGITIEEEMVVRVSILELEEEE